MSNVYDLEIKMNYFMSDTGNFKTYALPERVCAA